MQAPATLLASTTVCCPEVLFQPSFVGKEASGIHDNIFQSIMKATNNVIED